MWHDLSQPFHEEMPRPETLPVPEFSTIHDVAEDDINVQYYAVPTHIGTHVDAPRHFIEDGRTIDELPLSSLAGEGVVLDVAKDQPEEITVDDVESTGATVHRDDIVLLHTGWAEKYDTDGYDEHPWLSDELARYFTDIGPKMVVVDTITPDMPVPMRPEGWLEFPVHRTLLAEEILIAENVANLGAFLGDRVEVVAYPIKMRGGDGAPARIVARGV